MAPGAPAGGPRATPRQCFDGRKLTAEKDDTKRKAIAARYRPRV